MVDGGRDYGLLDGQDTREGFNGSAGLGLLLLFDLVRLDVAHGFRDGRWTFSVDVSRDFWPVL